MSRWTDAYKNLINSTSRNEIPNLIDSIEESHLETPEAILELARIKKVNVYLDENLKTTIPDFIPLNLINGVISHFTNVKNNLEQFESTKSNACLTRANTEYDALISKLTPYFSKGKSTPQAAAAAFKKYSETIEDALKQFIEDNSSLIESNAKFERELTALRTRTETYEEKLTDVEKKYLTGTEETPSLKAQFDALLVESKEWHTKIDGFYDHLFRAENGKESVETITLNQIKDIHEAITNANEKITTLNNFHNKVMGTVNKEGNIEGGLEKEVDSRIQALDDYKTDKEKIHSGLEDAINSLLPGATSAGLATAFKEEKEKCSDRVEQYTKAFYFSLVSILLVGVYSITKSFHFYPFSWEALPFSDFASFFENLLPRAPIVIPLALIAWFFSNRRNDYMRLEQEYTHKEAVASTVVSYRKQLEETGATVESELMKKFLAATIEIVQFNPAKTLNKKHKNDASVLNMDDIKGVAKQITDVKNIFK